MDTLLPFINFVYYSTVRIGNKVLFYIIKFGKRQLVNMSLNRIKKVWFRVKIRQFSHVNFEEMNDIILLSLVKLIFELAVKGDM